MGRIIVPRTQLSKAAVADEIRHRYELGRRAGLSHETATALAQPPEGGRRRLSGDDWPDQMPAELYDTAKYDTAEALLVDAPMWLRKLGVALSVLPQNPWFQTVGDMFANRGMPIICNVRVDAAAKDKGYICLDLKLRESVGGSGRTRYTSVRFPVGSVNAHDTTWCIAHLLQHITGRTVDAAFFKDLMLNETDMRHVHGAH